MGETPVEATAWTDSCIASSALGLSGTQTLDGRGEITSNITMLGVDADPVKAAASNGSGQMRAWQHLPGAKGQAGAGGQRLAQGVGVVHDLRHCEDVRGKWLMDDFLRVASLLLDTLLYSKTGCRLPDNVVENG